MSILTTEDIYASRVSSKPTIVDRQEPIIYSILLMRMRRHGNHYRQLPEGVTATSEGVPVGHGSNLW